MDIFVAVIHMRSPSIPYEMSDWLRSSATTQMLALPSDNSENIDFLAIFQSIMLQYCSLALVDRKGRDHSSSSSSFLLLFLIAQLVRITATNSYKVRIFGEN